MGEEIYKCEQCGRVVSKTNYHGIKVKNKIIHVCGKHYSQYQKYHKFLDDTPETQYTRNKYEITQEGVWIYCTNRQRNISGKFIIDKDDFDNVIQRKWRVWENNYCTGNNNIIQIHQFIMNPNNDQVVDHINGDRSDNRKQNLRVTTQGNNCINKDLQSNNTSGIAGVSWDKNRNRWAPEIAIGRKRCHLGRYYKFEDAVYARYVAEIVLFDEYRSFRNDKKIMQLVDVCTDKDRISKYVVNKLYNKNFFDTNK